MNLNDDPCCRQTPPTKLQKALTVIVAAGIFAAILIRLAVAITGEFQ
jgi:hypothetical protein